MTNLKIMPCAFCSRKGSKVYPVYKNEDELECPQCHSILIGTWLKSESRILGKTITFHPVEPIASEYNKIPYMYHGWERTTQAISSNVANIHTTQMALLDTDLFEKGYRVFVVDSKGEYEIVLGSKNSRTEREIRSSHNLFKLWRGGEFD